MGRNAKTASWFLLALLGIGAARAGETDRVGVGASPPILLPPFIAGGGATWYHAQGGGMEILYRCSESEAENLIEGNFWLNQLLAEILPPRLRVNFSVPPTAILFYADARPAVAPEVIDRMKGSDYAFLPNLMLSDRDATTVLFMLNPGANGASARSLRDGNSFDGRSITLSPEHIAFLLGKRVPALPEWFTTGFLAVFRQVTFGDAAGYSFDENRLSIGPMQWISKADTDAIQRNAANAVDLAPLADFFAGHVPRPPGRAAFNPTALWEAQAALFVRWGLEGDIGHREKFWTFVERVAEGMASESLFRETFGLDYTEAREALTRYRARAVRDTINLRSGRLGSPGRLVSREASAAEIARITGDWARLEVAFVKRIVPGLAPKYLEQARRTLGRAYDNGERDPRLLAAIGLTEIDAGNEERARDFLEMAARSGSMRPRAWYELARLRFAAIPQLTLTPAQAENILAPLLAAQRQDPPMLEVYQLIGEVMDTSDALPTLEHIAVLSAGARYYPVLGSLVERMELRRKGDEPASGAMPAGEPLRINTNDAASDLIHQLKGGNEAPIKEDVRRRKN